MSGCLRPLVRRFGAIERLKAARDQFRTGSDIGWIWIIPAVVALAIAAGVLAWLIGRRSKQARPVRRAPGRGIGPAGLSEQERRLLNSLGEVGGLERPETVYTMQTAFDHGIAGLIESGRTHKMSEERRSMTFRLLDGLRDKLGFGKPAHAEMDRPASTRQIPQGTKVFITNGHDAGSAAVIITGTDSDQLEVRPEIPVQCKPGEVWQVRYAHGAKVWAFDAPILGSDKEKIVLSHSEHVRLRNRRRFARIPLVRRAYLARLPFIKRARENEPPKFQRAYLIEIAGPGLKLASAMRPQPHERLLVTFRLHNKKIAEGVAQVRRLLPDRKGMAVFAAELIGLRPEELAELARESNTAARKKLAKPTSPKAKGWKAAAPQESSDVRPN